MFGLDWLPIKDGDPRACALFERHYSASTSRCRLGVNGRLFVGPGQKMVLMTPESDALFAWRKFIDASGQTGINCAVFRNEGERLASDLIKSACDLAWQRWPGERLYTYINPRKILSSNPGYCFKMAGWNACGRTKTRKLIILEKLPPKQSRGRDI